MFNAINGLQCDCKLYPVFYSGPVSGLITRGIVAFNFAPRNLTQVTSAMKPGQEYMVGFCFGKENNSSRRVILKIELELNNLNSILSRSAETPVCTPWDTHFEVSSSKLYFQTKHPSTGLGCSGDRLH